MAVRHRLVRHPLVRAGLVVLAVFVLLVGRAGAVPTVQPAQTPDRLPDACGSPNPYLVTTRFVDHFAGGDLGPEPAVVAFLDTLDDAAAHRVPLATYGEVGTVNGLAYDAVRRQLYAGAFMKRGGLFPPGGPGAIHRIDLATGSVERVTALAAGPADAHRMSQDRDAPAADHVGRMSLGDLEVDPEATTLFVANLFDGRIHRLALPDGRILGSFDHGGARLPGAMEMRPFGLAVHDGWLYHGIVDLSGATTDDPNPVGRIYRSRFDGSDMAEVVAFPLDPQGAPGPLPRWSWLDRPILSDIDFRSDGRMVVGVRNLAIDALLDERPARLGDAIEVVQEGGAWRAIVEPERYDDGLDGFDEVLTGGLAVVRNLDLVVGPGHAGEQGVDGATALWFDAQGGQARIEFLGSTDLDITPPLLGSGDAEVLCRPDVPLDPGLVATATEAVVRAASATAMARDATATAYATVLPATQTALAPTIAAAVPTRDALATEAARETVAPERATDAAETLERINSACRSDDPYVVVARQLQEKRSERAEARNPLTAVNRDDPEIALGEGARLGSLHGVAYDPGRSHVYAASYDASLAGSGGPGAIYRFELDSGRVHPWAIVPATRAGHRSSYVRNGVGDIDLDEGARELFAVGLSDRRIYRYAVPDGTLLGVLPNGAGAESWGSQAYPFALAVHDGWLYHGVVPDAVRPMPNREAVIYRSRPDGTEMAEVARIDLGYRRPGTSATHELAFVADIAFRPNGDPVVGLRDGTASPAGDLVPARALSGKWAVDYRKRYGTRGRIASGAMAAVPDADELVATASKELGEDAFSEDELDADVIWLDHATGALTGHRTLVHGTVSYVSRTIRDPDDGHVKRVRVRMAEFELLGDVESLCAAPMPTPTATRTPTPTRTPTRTPTPEPTPTRTVTPAPTATPTPSLTPTRMPRPIYLPVALGESCNVRLVRADVVLVVDSSTSMRSPARDGRPKLEAVQAAARAFVNLMDFSMDGGATDQVAIAGFNERAWVEQPLGADPKALLAAIDRLPDGMASGTRLDLAIGIGDQALAAPNRLPGNTPVIVLLTDGLPNGVPLGPGGTQEETILALADVARTDGIRVYTIGVGQADAEDPAYRINAELLRRIATQPDMFFETLDPTELAAIYAEIAYRLGCPPEAFWGGR